MSLDYKNLSLDDQDGIVIITINRPKSLNALNSETIHEIDDFFSSGFKSFEVLKGVVITGAGDKSFVAGADISEFNGLTEEEGQEFAKRGQDAFFLIEHFHVPVVAAVNGFALGGGCELAMACHLRVASENARFGQPEVNLALIPGYGGTQRLVQLIGKSKAMELLLTGRMMDAKEALSSGLINSICSSDDLMSTALGFIQKIASKGPVAIEKVIDSVNAFYDSSKDGYEVENQNFGITIGTEDSTEGAKAFLEKRKARFKGK